MNTKLNNKIVLITGGSGGIGQELVRQFHAEGAKIVIHYHQNTKAAKELVNELGDRCISVQADLRDELQVKKLWTEIESKLGPVDVLIANAGIYYHEDIPVHKMSLEQWNNTLSTNLTSVFLCVREFFKSIERHKLEDPAVVLIGSTAGIYGEAQHADYAASKAAMIYGFMASIKNEIVRIACHGRVNAICPTWTLTPMAEDFLKEPAGVIKAMQTVSLRKLVRPKDVATAAIYLASKEMSGHVSGQVLALAGGMEGRVLFSADEIDLNKV